MGTSYRRCDGYRERIRSFVITGYLRFRSSFFLIAITLFIFYTVCVILSTTVNIWSPVLDSEVFDKGSERHPEQAPAEVPVIDSGKPVGNDSVIDHGKPVGNNSVIDHGKPVGNDSVIDLGKPLGNDSMIDLENSPGKGPVVDLGNPLGKNPVINLGYSKYQGYTHKTGVTTWLGIRYAAPPIGDLRFAPPKDPPKHGGIQKADKRGKKCWGYRKRPDDTSFDEDCLFLDVYVPSNVSTGSKLPVLFFIPAGGFNFNAGATTDRSGLVAASEGSIIIVVAHYRVGPYGFIASKEIQASETASTNNGLKDQRKALEWVQKHISKFGGDPGHVVVGGASAGGASVSLHLTTYGGRDDGLFHAAAAQSASFGPVLDIPESQYQYDWLLDQLNCTDAEDTLACLRGKPATEIQVKNVNIPYPQGHSGQRAPKFMWNPVIDDDILQDHTYRAFYEGKFVRVPAIFGDDTNGASGFAPKGADTLREFNSFLDAQFPALTREQLDNIDILYESTGKQFPNTGSFWRQTGTAYGEIRYMCPNMFCASAMARYEGSRSWNYRYNVQVPALMESGYGVPHIAEQNAIWGPDYTHGLGWTSYLAENKAIIPVVQAYWVSFVRTYNPNTFRLPGSPKWEEWNPNKRRRLMIQTNNTQMEVVDSEQWRRCGYLSSIAVDIQQ